MDVVLIYSGITIALFISALITKRRFGLLGLALASGSILSDIWGLKFDKLLIYNGFPSSPLTSSIAMSLIILAPAIFLLFHGYAYKTFFGRLIGASFFTLLAMAFLIEPLGRVFMLEGYGKQVYDLLLNNQTTIIGICLIIAVVDLFFTKPAGLARSKK